MNWISQLKRRVIPTFCMYWGNINLVICFCGIVKINVPIVFYMFWGSIKPATCFCGIARIHVTILFYTYWDDIKLAICFCAIARIYVFYNVLYVLGQYKNCGESPEFTFSFVF